MLPSLDGAIFDSSNAAASPSQLEIKKLKLKPRKQSKQPEDTLPTFDSVGSSMPDLEDAAQELMPPPFIQAMLSEDSFSTPVSNSGLVRAPRARNDESNASDLPLFPALSSVSAPFRSYEALPRHIALRPRAPFP